jgi:short-subunit dehydrogenase
MVAKTISGKVIIITGASSGIGRATALQLARERARLALIARREDLLKSLAHEVQALGGSSLVMTLDLLQRDHVKKMIDSTRAHFGRIDVLINNAGFGFYGTLENTPADVVRDIFDLNFDAPLLASQLVIPIMRAQGSGHIINISSVAGKRGIPLSGIYSATKFALNAISEALRVELGDTGIDVSIINPGPTETEFGDHVRQVGIAQKFKMTRPPQSADAVAQCIVRCIQKPKAEVYPYRGGRLFAWASAIAPSLVDKVMARVMRDRMRPKVDQTT